MIPMLVPRMIAKAGPEIRRLLLCKTRTVRILPRGNILSAFALFLLQVSSVTTADLWFHVSLFSLPFNPYLIRFPLRPMTIPSLLNGPPLYILHQDLGTASSTLTSYLVPSQPQVSPPHQTQKRSVPSFLYIQVQLWLLNSSNRERIERRGRMLRRRDLFEMRKRESSWCGEMAIGMEKRVRIFDGREGWIPFG